MNAKLLFHHEGDTFEVHVRSNIIVQITKLIGGVVPRHISYFDLHPDLQEEIINRITNEPK